ncbi:DUF2848 family protein [Embleya hyalina]|uniref:DUF2848 domain-containing protein n=1 Tax=Embleya hyalina TaxID=516124 RepID=A0A401Z1P2_9ACTN|nr:DUF2848 family protein [Embleya hyalina]GCE00813.1 hypothetical protein EHYA_08539 [Embleya hyalina]
MSTSASPLRMRVVDTDEYLDVRPARLVVAGYTARDEAAARRHIEELAAIGIPPPATVPAFYDLDPSLLTTERSVAVDGEATSGEVEPVVIRHGDRLFLAVGSDHTDRERERLDITSSKAACPKPLGTDVIELDAGTDPPNWEHLTAESAIDGHPYQSGPLSALRHPRELLHRMTSAIGDVAGDLVLFCGTLPLLTGDFVYGSRWLLSIELPGGPSLTHDYTVHQRSS